MFIEAAIDALSAARRVAARDGVRGIVSRSLVHISDFRGAHRFLRTAATLDPQSLPGDVVDLVMSHRAVRPLQIKSEITQLAELVSGIRPRTALEIGTARGGTLFLFCRFADPDALIISVDLPEGEFGGGYRKWRHGIYERFASSGQTILLIRADSHSPATLDQVKGALGERSLDFLFIDGDHSYEGAKRDFEMYLPLVRPGGLVALHDIVPHPATTGCEVDRFWREIRDRFCSREIVEDPHQGTKGIGLVWV